MRVNQAVGWRWLAATAVIGVAALAGTACGSTSSGAASSGGAAGATGTPGGAAGAVPTASGQIAQWSITVDLTGSVPVSGTFQQKAGVGTGCGDWLQKGQGADGLMLPGGGTNTVNGQPFELNATITKFTGANMYESSAFDTSALAVMVDQSSEQDPFQPDPSATSVNVSATINSDGSGKFTFSGWMDPGSRNESGTVSWTCTNV